MYVKLNEFIEELLKLQKESKGEPTTENWDRYRNRKIE